MDIIIPLDNGKHLFQVAHSAGMTSGIDFSDRSLHLLGSDDEQQRQTQYLERLYKIIALIFLKDLSSSDIKVALDIDLLGQSGCFALDDNSYSTGFGYLLAVSKAILEETSDSKIRDDSVIFATGKIDASYNIDKVEGITGKLEAISQHCRQININGANIKLILPELNYIEIEDDKYLHTIIEEHSIKIITVNSLPELISVVSNTSDIFAENGNYIEIATINRLIKDHLVPLEKQLSSCEYIYKIPNVLRRKFDDYLKEIASSFSMGDQIDLLFNEDSFNVHGFKDNIKSDHDLVVTADTVCNLSVYQSEFLKFDKFDYPFVELANLLANQVTNLFETAISNREIEESSLFDFSYIKIKDTNPQQYTTKFSKFCDKNLPEIQEIDNPRIASCVTIDKNGYVPRHINARHNLPIVGHEHINMLNSRSLRIYKDLPTVRCISNRNKFIFQNYAIPYLGGQIAFIKECAAPIFVCNQYWGAFRVTYDVNIVNKNGVNILDELFKNNPHLLSEFNDHEKSYKS